jgi:hypothetical protein
MTNELRDHLLCIIEEAIARGEDHLDWLALHPNEPDRDTTGDRLEQAVAR